MNILMLVKNSEIGGVVSCVKSLADGLKAKGDKTVIGTCQGEGVDKMLSGGGYNVHIIDFGTKNIVSVIRNLLKIQKIVKTEKIDVIHAQNRLPALYASIICFFNKKVNYIWSNHLVPIPCDFLHKMTTRYGKFAVAEGIAGKEFLINKFNIPESKVKVVNLGSDISSFTKISKDKQEELKKKWNIQSEDKVILLYGRLAPVKGHSFLLKAVSLLDNEKKSHLKIVFPGQGEEYKNKLVHLTLKYGLEDALIFPGYIEGRDYLSIADLMVLPSKQEGFGIVNVESFAMGVPVIRTKTAGWLDMQDCCMGVEYGDVKSLVKYINYLWNSPQILEDQVKIASQNVKRFSIEKMTDEYRKIYAASMK